jgi:hypothetical protein
MRSLPPARLGSSGSSAATSQREDFTPACPTDSAIRPRSRSDRRRDAAGSQPVDLASERVGVERWQIVAIDTPPAVRIRCPHLPEIRCQAAIASATVSADRAAPHPGASLLAWSRSCSSRPSSPASTPVKRSSRSPTVPGPRRSSSATMRGGFTFPTGLGDHSTQRRQCWMP